MVFSFLVREMRDIGKRQSVECMESHLNDDGAVVEIGHPEF